MNRITLLLIILLATFPSSSFAQQEIKAVVYEWCPYMCTKQPGKVGYATEVLIAALKEAGYTVKVEVVNNDYMALTKLREGEADVVPVLKKNDAAEFLTPVNDIGKSENMFFIKTGSDWYYTNPVSLQRLDKLGLLQGVRYEPMIELHKRKQKDSVVMASKSDGVIGLLQMLLDGKAGAVLGDANSLNFHKTLLEEGDQIRLVGTLRNPELLVTAFNSSQNAQLDIYEQGVANLKEKELYNAILSRYGLKPQP